MMRVRDRALAHSTPEIARTPMLQLRMRPNWRRVLSVLGVIVFLTAAGPAAATKYACNWTLA